MAGVKRGYWRCAVRLLDGAVVNHDISQKAIGQVLLESVLKDLDVREKEYFSLRFPDNQGSKWLDLEKQLKKQVKMVPMNGCVKLDFCIRYYPPETTCMQEEITRYQLFLQLRRDILENRLELPFRLAAELFALCLQAELGDFEHLLQRQGYAEDFHFSPDQSLDMSQLAEDYHQSGFCSGLTPAEAEDCFLDKVRLLDTYGADIYTVEGMNNHRLRLALTPRGITAFREGSRDDNYAWPKLLKMTCKRKKLTFQLFTGKDDHAREVTVCYIAPTAEDCKYLHQLCLDAHAFYTHILGSGHIVQPIKRGIFSRSSRHRASGQLEWLKHREQRKQRDPPDFERSSSVRFSRGNDAANSRMGFSRTASVRVISDSSVAGFRRAGPANFTKVSRCHSVASGTPTTASQQVASSTRDLHRTVSTDHPRLGAAGSVGDVTLGKPRVLTTYSAARFRRGSSTSLASFPASPPMSPTSPVFVNHSRRARDSGNSFDSTDGPTARSTAQVKQNYRADQRQAVQDAARSLSTITQSATDVRYADRPENLHLPLNRARGRRNQPMAVVLPSRKSPPSTHAEFPSLPVKDSVKDLASEVAGAMAPLLSPYSKEKDAHVHAAESKTKQRLVTRTIKYGSSSSIRKRPPSNSDTSYSEGSDADSKTPADEGPPAYCSEVDSEVELKKPTDDAYSKALRDIWVQQDLPPPPPHLLTLASKADRESKEMPCPGYHEDTDPTPPPPTPPTNQRASPFHRRVDASSSSSVTRRSGNSPLHRIVRGTSQQSLFSSKDPSSSKAHSLPQGMSPSDMHAFSRAASLPRSIKPSWKMPPSSVAATQESAASSGVSPVHTRQPVEVTRLVTRVRASSRTSHSSADSGEESSSSPKHQRSARSTPVVSPETASKHHAFQSLSSGIPKPDYSHKLSSSAEDLFSEIQLALDEQSRELLKVSTDIQKQIDTVQSKTSPTSSSFSPPPLSSDEAVFSPSSESDSASEGPRIVSANRRERQVVKPVRRHQSMDPDNLRRQQQQHDLDMVAQIRKRYALSACSSRQDTSVATGKTPPVGSGMPTASHPYISDHKPPSFAPTVPSPLRKQLSASQIRTVRPVDGLPRRPIRAASSHQLVKGSFPHLQQLET